MKKKTSARIEDSLDIISDKMIDLESTAKKIALIEKSINNSIARVESLTIKVNTSELEHQFKDTMQRQEELNKKHLKALDKRNKLHKPLYYFVLLLMLVIGILSYMYILKKEEIDALTKEKEQLIKHFQEFIRENKRVKTRFILSFFAYPTPYP